MASWISSSNIIFDSNRDRNVSDFESLFRATVTGASILNRLAACRLKGPTALAAGVMVRKVPFEARG